VDGPGDDESPRSGDRGLSHAVAPKGFEPSLPP
jgi:hypothetical protein